MGWRKDMARLTSATERAIASAGPRYSPGLDPAAPNLPVERLVAALESIAVSAEFRGRLDKAAADVSERWSRAQRSEPSVFVRRAIDPDRVAHHLVSLSSAPESTMGATARQARRDCDIVRGRVTLAVDRLRDEYLSNTTRDDAEARRLENSRRLWTQLSDSLEAAETLLEGPTGQLAFGGSTLLIRGQWGTGKTHLLCDMSRTLSAHGHPVLLAMAQQIPRGMDPLDAVAVNSGVAPTGTDLLTTLDNLGAQLGRRALIVVDAVNEGDRGAWQAAMEPLLRALRRYPNVRLVLSCRSPFDDLIFSKATSRSLVRYEHFGWEDYGFDAQIAFFAYYGLSAPPVPLLVAEFSRPLFLKLFCEAIRRKAKSTQQRAIRELAAGQKSMTYLLEHFVREVGRGAAADFGLKDMSIWKLFKGDSHGDGFAGWMASNQRDWLTSAEAETLTSAGLGISTATADALLIRLVADGLLSEDVSYASGTPTTVFRFTYQRFADHLIARHLLAVHLDTSSELSARRSFYANRPLGRIFRLDSWSSQYEEPGLATAVMMEFPERVKKLGWAQELVYILPRQRRRLEPAMRSFLDGLPWRGNDSFSSSTERLVRNLLWDYEGYARETTLETLITVAARPDSRFNAAWLWAELAPLSMADRDVTWSEFVRTADDTSAVHRLVAWSERTEGAAAPSDWARNEMSLLALLLTTTDRGLRDRATRALRNRGFAHPEELHSVMLESLNFNDIYVRERVLAAAYGVAMECDRVRDPSAYAQDLSSTSRSLVAQMFESGAPATTSHALIREYAKGILAVSRRLVPRVLSPKQRATVDALPLAYVFPPPRSIVASEVADANSAMHMDFANYTLGRLVPGRGAYEDSHPGYSDVRLQISWRISNLGYTSQRFGDIDKRIARMSFDRDGAKRTDRYGKKYSWISFFEMYGMRSDEGLLTDPWESGRPSDVDIDPSFPPDPRAWVPELPNLFYRTPTSSGRWLRDGPTLDASLLQEVDIVDGVPGPWVLLYADLARNGSHSRRYWSRVHTVLVPNRSIERFRRLNAAYEGRWHDQLEPYQDATTYWGEVPWSDAVARHLRRPSGGWSRQHASLFDSRANGRTVPGVTIEIPIYRWNWTSEHSSLNQVSGVEYPAPSLCNSLRLFRQTDNFDLVDSAGLVATIYRRHREPNTYRESDYLFIRRDLIEDYLRLGNSVLVWLASGERTVDRDWSSPSPSDVEEAITNQCNRFAQTTEFRVLGSATQGP